MRVEGRGGDCDKADGAEGEYLSFEFETPPAILEFAHGNSHMLYLCYNPAKLGTNVHTPRTS